MSNDEPFKTCPMCDTEWSTRQEFLDDVDVTLVGYQVNFVELQAGLFLFNHSCRGTMALAVDLFADLYGGPIFEERATGSDDCPGHCLQETVLERCPAKCECAFVREVMAIISKAPREPDMAPN